MFHTVFFWLKPELSVEERDLFERELLHLLDIPYLAQGQVGKPADTAHREGVTEHSFDYSLILEFKTMEDHDHYQSKDPDHDRFVDTCKGLWSKVRVFDSRTLRP